MGLLDWFKKPQEVSYNSIYENTVTLSDTTNNYISVAGTYSREVASSYYYFGYLINSGSLYDITIVILKSDGYTIGPLTMEPITKLAIKGLGIKQLIVSGNSSATFRYDMIGSTQPPLPGTESIEISPYQKTYTQESINLVENGVITGPSTSTVEIYTVPDGYRLEIYSAVVRLITAGATGSRRVLVQTGTIYDIASNRILSTILADTGSVTGTTTQYAGVGGMASETIDNPMSDNVNYIGWGSKMIVGPGNSIYIAVNILTSDTVAYFGLDSMLIQI